MGRFLMAKTPRNSFRIYTGPNGKKEMAAIDAIGSVVPLVPQEKHRRLRDGYYTYDLKLIRLDPKPGSYGGRRAG